MTERLDDDELYDEMYTLPKRGGKDTVDGPQILVLRCKGLSLGTTGQASLSVAIPVLLL